jgi:hypothetical protein
MDRLLFVLTQKVAIAFVMSLAPLGSLLTLGSTSTTPTVLPIANSAVAADAQFQTAIIYNATTPVSTTSTPDNATLPAITPGLLPSTTTPFCAASSTCGKRGIKTLISSLGWATANSSTHPSQPTAIVVKKVSLQKPAATETKPVQTPTTPTASAATMTTNISAQDLLAGATTTFRELIAGPYEVTLKNSTAGISWPLDATAVPTTAPAFASSFSCDPAPDVATPDALDQSPSFEPSHAYACTVSLTPTTGADRRTQSKVFSFTTPPGQMVVGVASAMSALLANGINNGGIVFTNKDASPASITSLTFDVSYTALNTLNGPLVLRFLDPKTNQSLFDYHLENIPSDAATPYTNTQTGITASLTFAIPAGTQRMLPIEVLGVQRMIMSGTSPTIKITLHNVITDRANMPIVIASPEIAWSCTVALTAWDPNATDSPYATGQVCQN